MLHDTSYSDRDSELPASASEIGQLIHHAVKPATQSSEYSSSVLRSILNLALLQQWHPAQIMESLRRHLGLTSAHELETLEQELFILTPTAGEPLSAFLLRFSVVLAQHNAVAEQQNLPDLSDR